MEDIDETMREEMELRNCDAEMLLACKQRFSSQLKARDATNEQPRKPPFRVREGVARHIVFPTQFSCIC